MATKMERIEQNNEFIFIDLNDVLDILFQNENNLYTVIFNDGEILYNSKINKKIINKFEKLKKDRKQINN